MRRLRSYLPLGRSLSRPIRILLIYGSLLTCGTLFVMMVRAWIDGELRGGEARKWDRWGCTCIEKGDLGEAIRSLHIAISIDPESEAHNNLAWALMLKGHLNESILEGRIAVRLYPNHSWCHDTLGQALARKGETAEALAECRKAVDLDPNAADYVGLGYALYAAGRREEARAQWQQVLHLRDARQSRIASGYLKSFFPKDGTDRRNVRSHPAISVSSERHHAP